jgi:hypothetical protein
MQGRRMQSAIPYSASGNTLVVNVASAPDGMFLLEAITAEGTTRQRLLKVKP